MKQLSSSLTFVWKFIFPTIWLGGFGLGTIAAIATQGFDSLHMLLFWLFGFALVYYLCFRAKRVYIDDNYLYVGNYRRKTEIPLANIKYVSENTMITPRPIFIEFKEETAFGKKIMFIGYTEMFLFFSAHPAIRDINIRIQNNREKLDSARD